jgi:hypothetical protein
LVCNCVIETKVLFWEGTAVPARLRPVRAGLHAARPAVPGKRVLGRAAAWRSRAVRDGAIV